MKLKSKKFISILTAVLLMLTMFAGCKNSTNSTGTNTFAYSDTTNEAPKSTTVRGIVKSINGQEITLEVFDGNGMELRNGMKGRNSMTPPEMPNGENGSNDDNSSSETKSPTLPNSSDDSSTNKSDEKNEDKKSDEKKSSESKNGGKNSDGNNSNERPSKPDSDNSGSSTTAPEMPNGDNGNNGNSMTPPEMPNGENGSTMTPPEMPNGNSSNRGNGFPGMNGSRGGMMQGRHMDNEIQTKEAKLTIGDESVITGGSFSDIKENTMLEITFDENGKITAIAISEGMGNKDSDRKEGMNPPGGGSSSANVTYTSVKEFTEDTTLDGESVSSTGTDENAILVSDNATVQLNNVTVTRNSSDSTGGDNSSFYGVGAAVLTKSGKLIIKNANITTNSAGGAGVFAYSDGVVYIENSTIETTSNTSGGIHAAGGGTLYAWDNTVTTHGESSAAIRSDRGGGTMVVDGGTYTSTGTGSPAIYCTADISVNDAKLVATGSEAICIEGLNSLRIFDSDIEGDMPDQSQNDTTWTIIVYQSMSGDSEIGNSTLHIVDGSITSKNGGLIYTTNTQCDILLSDVDITYSDDSEFFLMCTGNTNQRGWGSSGANGSDCTFTADNQEMQGKVIYDSISDLDFYMKNESVLTGCFVDDETYAGNGGNGYCNVYIDSISKWIVTASSTVTTLANEGEIVDANGKTVSIVGTDGTTFVQGNSEYTITVSSYLTTADMNGASSTPVWSDYAVEKIA